MFQAGDPIGSLIVTNLSRPGVNVTGLGGFGPGMHGKMLELLKEAVPAAKSFGVVWNPAFALHTAYVAEIDVTARARGVALKPFEVGTPADVEPAFAAIASARANALIVLAQPLVFVQRLRIARLAAEHCVPTIYVWREMAEAGGLMSYGSDINDGARRAARFVDKSLNGAKPRDLPVEQPTRFYFVINLRTVKLLGLVLPPSLLLRADEVIE